MKIRKLVVCILLVAYITSATIIGMGTSTDTHRTHIGSPKGPYMNCKDCHTRSLPNFVDGKPFADTTICDTCHSKGGIYDGVNDPVIGAKANWRDSIYNSSGTGLKSGKERWCVGCHDNIPAIIKGENASNKTGDNVNYGYYITGHGRMTNYPSMSWQSTQDSGNPGANKSCDVCHDVNSSHIISGQNPESHRLKLGYENGQDNRNCNNCHTLGGSATSDPQFYVSSESYEMSAHGGSNCTDCHEIHGTDNRGGGNIGKGMTVERDESLCYKCHTEGMIRNDALSNNRPGGYVSANDIQEAFGKFEKHDLGTSFSIDTGNGIKSYTLECTSCHNIHVVTGKYWDAPSGKSPVTRFSNNIDVWGDRMGEKMNDFAALGSGSGGWYFSIARGRNIIFDQKAVYQPPMSGDGYNFEFSGDILPDYDTFCLDCHSNRVSDDNPPVNWGQGIPCTGNSVDPPNQRVECGGQHGLGAANNPSYMTDQGLLGSGGNPDPIFNQTGVTRGRGVGHFMRWPYETTDRIAGINFVMSCTDCHEAHGSNRGSMIRERFNTNSNGACGTGSNGQNCVDAGNWNSYCNACHYYYGGQHNGMSCGSASCHEVNSLHRIIHNTGSGSTSLWVEPSRPSNTPEIVNVNSDIGNNEIIITFNKGVYTESNRTGALKKEDFMLVDVGNDNPKTIIDIVHDAGSSTVKMIIDRPIIVTDLYTDTVAAMGISIWDSNGLPAGPWPVSISLGSIKFGLNEPAGSTIARDESGLVSGTVSSPGESFTGDGYLHGDGIDNYIDFENYDSSLKAATKLKIDTRLMPTNIGTGEYIKRIFARDSGNKNYQLSIWRNNTVFAPYYNAPDGAASIAFWVKPVDAHGGVAWKPVLTDYILYPIMSDHYYKIRLEWNSSNVGRIPGSIYVDDQGTDGNDLGENWAGFIDITDSDQSQLPANRKLYEGDVIDIGDGDFTIGSNVNVHTNNVFKGSIDYVNVSII